MAVCRCRCGATVPDGKHYVPGHWIAMLKVPLSERFWWDVDRTSDTGCWEWHGVRNQRGYGQVSVTGQIRATHRVAWELTHGPIPPGMIVCHRCDNPPCVRPDHLFLGTHRDNTVDSMTKGRLVSGGRHWTRQYPDRLLKGDAHHSRLHPERVLRGSAHGRAKLTEADVVVIRARYANGHESYATLAREFGVTEAMIRFIVKRWNWKHVP